MKSMSMPAVAVAVAAAFAAIGLVQLPVRGAAPPAGSSHTGELVSVGDGLLMMTVKGQEAHSHRVNADTKVTIGNQPAKLADLRKGDLITVTMAADNLVSSIAARREGPNPGPNPQHQSVAPAAPVAQAQEPSPTQTAPQAPGTRAPGVPRRNPRSNEASGPARAPIRLGVHVAPSPTTGVLVMAVQPESPAARAGIRNGDYLLSAGGTDLNSTESLTEALSQRAADDRLDVVVWRNGRRETIAVTLFAMPPEQNGFGPQGDRNPRFAAKDTTPWWGVNLVKSGDAPGAVVAAVYPASPAARAGLQHGDRIVALGTTKIESPRDVSRTAHGHKAGEACEVSVVRDGQPVKLNLTAACRGDVFGEFQPTFARDDDESFTEFEDGDITESALRLEHDRRMAEQHERIEEELRQLREEIRKLREELSGRK